MLPTVFLLWAFFIDVRLFYGNFNINKLSIQTMLYAYASLAFFLVYNIVAAFYTVFHPYLFTLDGFRSYLTSEMFKKCMWPLLNCFQFCVFTFMGSIVKENVLLLAYIMFQKVVAFN
jgi:hypothetical protein